MRIQRIYLGQVAMANVLSHATVRLAAASMSAPLRRLRRVPPMLLPGSTQGSQAAGDTASYQTLR